MAGPLRVGARAAAAEAATAMQAREKKKQRKQLTAIAHLLPPLLLPLLSSVHSLSLSLSGSLIKASCLVLLG